MLLVMVETILVGLLLVLAIILITNPIGQRQQKIKEYPVITP